MTDDAFHLTALDVRRYDFGNALRGYDRARVDLFREQVADELERLSRANQELEVKARNFHEQLRAFRERDKALNDALISAQQLRGEIREQAQREAQLIIREAQGDAERNVEALRGEIRRAEDELQQLSRNRRSYVQQLRQLMERQLHDLDSAEMVPPPGGVMHQEAARETSRESNPPPVREFQTPSAAPRVVPTVRPAPQLSQAVVEAPLPAMPAQPLPQQPWARSTGTEQVAPQPVAPPSVPPQQVAPVPLMQPVPHPLPPVTQSAQGVPPLSPRPSLPTPSWLDVVEGE